MVLCPGSVVGKRHEVEVEAISVGSTAALAAFTAGAAGRGNNSVSFLSSSDTRAKFDSGAGGFVALCDDGDSSGECTANKAEVGVLDTAVRNFDEYCAGAGVWDRDFLKGDRAIRCVKTLCEHSFGHHGSLVCASVSVSTLLNMVIITYAHRYV